MAIKITVWNEFVHERFDEKIKRVYPEGIHMALKKELEGDSELCVRTATLDMPDHGLSDELLYDTDVLFWWGHMAHEKVDDKIAELVARHVRLGMGFVPLHSAHHSKPFKLLMGTTCNLCWREIGENERLWVVNPAHPICEGIDRFIELEHEEMYGECFDIPTPDELLMISWFRGGEVFRSACTFNRGYGKIFYFRPGHEEFPTYHNPQIVRVLKNAAHWAAPRTRIKESSAPMVDPPEKGVLELYEVKRD